MPHCGQTLTFVSLARSVRAHIGQDHRFAHTVRVARLADRLAQRHGENPHRARLAGLLHDLARLYPADRLTRECERRGLPVDGFERRNPIVLHAPLGAALARELFAVDDPGVLSAISKHTLASPAMTRLDKIVYIADAAEPGRAYAERAGFEALAFRDLDAAMAAVLRSTLQYLSARGLAAAPQTPAALVACAALERSPLSA